MQGGCCEEKDRHIPTVVMDNFLAKKKISGSEGCTSGRVGSEIAEFQRQRKG
jgi:hypothetical protein